MFDPSLDLNGARGISGSFTKKFLLPARALPIFYETNAAFSGSVEKVRIHLD